VTGGTKGAGKAIAERLKRAGAQVIVTARNAPDDTGHGLYFVAADLSAPEGAADVAKVVFGKFGGVDILVNNLGGSETPAGGFAVLTDVDWEQTLQINLLAPVRLDRAFLPQMLTTGSGRISPSACTQGMLPLHAWTLPNAAAKAGLINFCKRLSTEVSCEAARVPTVSPGGIMTDAAQRRTQPISESSGISAEEAT